MSVEGSVRERRRAETVGEIKAAALQQLAEGGTGALSLRGVARSVGMTVQSLYHYFDSRDALLTALVADAHHRLADAVQAAAEATRGRPPLQRRLAATAAYRDWALANRSAFLLLYGTPVPGFTPAADSGRPARPRSGWPRRSWTWCSTAGPPSSWPRSRCPATRDRRAGLEDRAADRRAGLLHRAARADARPGDARAARPPAPVRRRGRRAVTPRPCTGCPTPGRTAARLTRPSRAHVTRSRSWRPRTSRGVARHGGCVRGGQRSRLVGEQAGAAGPATAGRRRSSGGSSCQQPVVHLEVVAAQWVLGERGAAASTSSESSTSAAQAWPPARRAASRISGASERGSSGPPPARSASAVCPARSARRTVPKSVSTSASSRYGPGAQHVGADHRAQPQDLPAHRGRVAVLAVEPQRQPLRGQPVRVQGQRGEQLGRAQRERDRRAVEHRGRASRRS